MDRDYIRTWYNTLPAPWKAIGILTILYSVGILGVCLPLHPDFMLLTPFNLLCSVFIMLWFHPTWNTNTWLYIGICYTTGFLAELIGVQTGLLFGDYQYGDVLGPKIWGTPLMIGVNWVLLTFAAAAWATWILPASVHPILKACIAALAMIMLDFLIEPDAMKYGMWFWENNTIPIQNYLGWFYVAFPLQLLYVYRVKGAQNIVGVALFILQILFFIII